MHELDSIMLYIHPTLAIIGYFFIYATLLYLVKLKTWRVPTDDEVDKYISELRTRKLLYYFSVLAWLFTLLGLVTGMIWAQIAWGAYWGWDPKETCTLLLFLSQSGYFYYYYKFQSPRSLLALSGLSCGMVVVNLLIAFIVPGLHSFI